MTRLHRRLHQTAWSLSVALLLLPLVSGCGDSGGGGGSRRGGYERLSMMSNFYGAYRTFAANGGGGWGVNTASASANLISGAPSLQGAIEPISDDCYGYRGVTSFASEEGVSPIVLETPLQTGTAVYDGTKYVISGLQFGPVFSSSNDTLTISHDDGAGNVISDSVGAPAMMADPNAHIGTPAGLGTLFSAPEGGFDIMYVFVALAGGGTGSAGAVCQFDAAEMTLAGNMRQHALVDDATAAWIADEALTPVTVYAAYMRQKSPVVGFFADDIVLQAGVMFEIDYADL